MSFSEKNENKKKKIKNKKSIEEIFRKLLLKIDDFHRVKKRHFSIYKTRPVSVTMETDRKNIMLLFHACLGNS